MIKTPSLSQALRISKFSLNPRAGIRRVRGNVIKTPATFDVLDMKGQLEDALSKFCRDLLESTHD